MAIWAKDDEVLCCVVAAIIILMMYDKNVLNLIVTAVYTLLDQTAPLNPFSVTMHCWFGLPHQKTAADFVANRALIDSSGWGPFKLSPTNCASQSHTTSIAHSHVITVSRAIFCRLDSKIDNLKRLTANCALHFHATIGSMKYPEAFARAEFKFCPSIARHFNLIAALTTTHQFGGSHAIA